jgi:hypothetical protein
MAHQLARAGDDLSGGQSRCKHVESGRKGGGCGGRSAGTQGISSYGLRISNSASLRVGYESHALDHATSQIYNRAEN